MSVALAHPSKACGRDIIWFRAQSFDSLRFNAALAFEDSESAETSGIVESQFVPATVEADAQVGMFFYRCVGIADV